MARRSTFAFPLRLSKMVGMKLLACAALAATSIFSQTSPLADRVGSTGFLQLRAESFRTLEPRQKELAYWLVQASIAIDPIIYDQLSAYGIREKRLLEEIVSHPAGIDPAQLKNITS